MNLRRLLLRMLGSRTENDEPDPRLRLIEQTRPIATEPIPENGPVSSAIGIHLLANDYSLHQSLWAAKSFYASTSERFPLTVHLQGQQTTALESAFRLHFPAARLITQQAADQFAEPWLYDNGLHRLLQLRKNLFLLMKLVDLRLFARTPLIIYFDTDVLFFRCPAEIVTTPADIARTPHLFMRDDYDSYCITPERARDDLAIDLLPRAHAGLMRLVTDRIDLPSCERMVAHADLCESHWHLEQTLHAMNASDRGPVSLLPSTYAMTSGLRNSPRLVARHYISPLRRLLASEGIAHLLKSGFCESLAATIPLHAPQS